MIDAMYATKKDLAAVNHYFNWPITLKGEIREAWGLGSVWKTCCGAIYGMYYDEERNKYIAM